MPDCSRKASVRVRRGGDIFRNATRSTGWSISIAMPGCRMISGSIPRATRRIEMGVEAVVAETQRNGVRRRTDDRVRSEFVVRRHDGEGRGGPMRRQRSGDLGCRYQRNVAGHRHHAGSALADEQARGGGDGAGMAFPRAFPDDAGAVAAGERCRDRINRDDEEAGELSDRAHGVEHVLEHDRRERTTFLEAQARRQPLLGVRQFLDGHDGPDATHGRSRPLFTEASASAASRTTRASCSRSARSVISVGASVTLGAKRAASFASAISIT